MTSIARAIRSVMRSLRGAGAIAAVMLVTASAATARGQNVMSAEAGAELYRETIEPIVMDYCYGCHGLGSTEGGVALDAFSSALAAVENRELWQRALKMVRAGMMPPVGEDRPSPDELKQLQDWIKLAVFKIDPDNPDPGEVRITRLNRAQYRNTVRDLIGVDFNTDDFPADGTGHGFDTLGEVLSISPLLLEKYIDAAQTIVSEAVPIEAGVAVEAKVLGAQFASTLAPAEPAEESEQIEQPVEEEVPAFGRRGGRRGGRGGRGGAMALGVQGDGYIFSYYEPAAAAATFVAEHPGTYEIVMDLQALQQHVEGQNDQNLVDFVFKIDGEEVLDFEFSRQGYDRRYVYTFDQTWEAGEHVLAAEVTPVTNEPQLRSLRLQINNLTVRGPLERQYLVQPEGHEKFFPKPIPESIDQRREYASELLAAFATKAFRRPIDEETLDRLVGLAEITYTAPNTTFEAGVAQAMAAVLASPRFIFREEHMDVDSAGPYPLLDEYSLASRLSYFLWSTMPDEELFRLAGEGQLRANLTTQVDRMLKDPRSEQFVENFVGQWLQARDIETVPINSFAVVARDASPEPEDAATADAGGENAFGQGFGGRGGRGGRQGRGQRGFAGRGRGRGGRRGGFGGFGGGPELSDEVRQAMRKETQQFFSYIVKEDRSLLELLDSDYTFLNESLAAYYEIEGVTGDQMRRVELPEDNPRGGVLTQGTVLAVTSNPDRTSPVKRGVFIIDNILGLPSLAPPGGVPALEETENAVEEPQTLRAVLELHRADPSCASCHARMDPLGLALENFNAMGRFRNEERGKPIDPAGTLVTGESFTTVQEFKEILTTNRSRDFYRCLTEKMMIYALGRGIEYYDAVTIDKIVDRIEAAEGRPSALLLGIIESAPFQRRRASGVQVAGSE